MPFLLLYGFRNLLYNLITRLSKQTRRNGRQIPQAAKCVHIQLCSGKIIGCIRIRGYVIRNTSGLHLGRQGFQSCIQTSSSRLWLCSKALHRKTPSCLNESLSHRITTKAWNIGLLIELRTDARTNINTQGSPFDGRRFWNSLSMAKESVVVYRVTFRNRHHLQMILSVCSKRLKLRRSVGKATLAPHRIRHNS